MSPEYILVTLPDFSKHLTSTLGRSPNTAKAYTSDVRCLARFLKWSHVATTAAGDNLAVAFVDWLRSDQRNGPPTVKRKLAALSVYFSWQVRAGSIEKPLLDDSEVEIRLPKRLPRAVSRNDVVKLLQSCKPGTTEHIMRDTELALRLLIATGVRISELCAIDVGDVSTDGASIRIKGKGSRERIVFVCNAELRRSLAHARDVKSVNVRDALFLSRRRERLTPQTFRLRLHRLRLTSGLADRITPHSLRHTAATLFLESGVDIRFVQRLLGHANISTTEIYTRVVDESLKNALLKADPLRGM